MFVDHLRNGALHSAFGNSIELQILFEMPGNIDLCSHGETEFQYQDRKDGDHPEDHHHRHPIRFSYSKPQFLHFQSTMNTSEFSCNRGTPFSWGPRGPDPRPKNSWSNPSLFTLV